MNNMIIADRLRTNNYRLYSYELANFIGVKSAILISYLIDQDIFINSTNVGKEFYKEKWYIELYTGLSDDEQLNALKKLKELEVVEVTRRGTPPKNFYKINYYKLESLLNDSIKYAEELKKCLKENNDGSIFKELKSSSLKNWKAVHINNKDLNKKYTNILLHNTLGEAELHQEELIEENNIKEEKEDVKSMDVLVEEEHKSSNISQPAQPPKKKGGIAPMIDEIEKRYRRLYPDLANILQNYLKSFLGRRKLPTLEQWIQMLNQLESYSSIRLVNAQGYKFKPNCAWEIVNKALQGKDGQSFTSFDDVFGYGKLTEQKYVMEPQFNLNQEFKKGY